MCNYAHTQILRLLIQIIGLVVLIKMFMSTKWMYLRKWWAYVRNVWQKQYLSRFGEIHGKGFFCSCGINHGKIVPHNSDEYKINMKALYFIYCLWILSVCTYILLHIHSTIFARIHRFSVCWHNFPSVNTPRHKTNTTCDVGPLVCTSNNRTDAETYM